ncbi:MAG: hypothetical protein ACLTMR_06340 [Faecalibacillus sp.]
MITVSEYSFYYFGTGKEKIDNVTNVYVSSAEQGENAMVEAIRKEALDIVLCGHNVRKHIVMYIMKCLLMVFMF